MSFYVSFFVSGTEIVRNTTTGEDYIIIPHINNPTSDILISFKVKTCGNAYIGLMSAAPDIFPLYEIVIDFVIKTFTSYVRICRGLAVHGICTYMQSKFYCYSNTYFFITWNDTSITVGQGLEINGPELLTWTSFDNLRPIFNVGIHTLWKGSWIFYTVGKEIQSNCVID